MRRILVVDDNRDLARGVALVLGDALEDVTIDVAHSAEEALAKPAADVVFTDVKMPGMDGVELLRTLRLRRAGTRVVLFTGYGTIESAVEAMKRGAMDYLSKPFDNDDLVALARRALGELDAEEADPAAHDLAGIVARDRRMRPVLELIRKVGPTSATVLVQGESGTGKERVAHALHALSPRAHKPFVAFNAAAIAESLAEAELFGARKGAYTGADRDRKGLFVEASGGTLFIDEVSSMPSGLQGKLLRALEAREVLPVGATIPVPVDVRIIAATNVDLAHQAGFRKDLYYRLSVVRVVIPPLRERPDDVPLLAALALERHPKKRLSPGALARLVAHDWPGNVRELMNVIERAAILSSKDEIGSAEILFEDDPLSLAVAAENVGYDEAKQRAIEDFQRRYVERLLAASDGNLSAAARQAGITRAALHRILKRIGLPLRE